LFKINKKQITANPFQIEQIILNLVTNTNEALFKRGIIQKWHHDPHFWIYPVRKGIDHECGICNWL